mgnify:CR=1 FL=1
MLLASQVTCPALTVQSPSGSSAQEARGRDAVTSEVGALALLARWRVGAGWSGGVMRRAARWVWNALSPKKKTF